jgi:heme exporter protein D
MSEFLHMGGYAGYVWPAYAVAAAVLIALVWHSVRSLRVNQRELAEAEEASPRTRRRAAGER